MIDDELILGAKECPFCHGTPPYLDVKTEGRNYFVFCTACRAKGPPSVSDVICIDLWNRRGPRHRGGTNEKRS